ncbi:MAG: leucine-rich repeat domain-containing protein, partial [Clostridia bacterium]|nr:leucine-rich repeat domain-containing protein [Clostridia bacterium]
SVTISVSPSDKELYWYLCTMPKSNYDYYVTDEKLYGYKGEMPVGTEISELPSYITTMAKKAFYSCKNLKSIQIPSGWTSLGGEMIFSFCQGLEEVILPDGMMEIPSDTFMGCSALKRLNEPNSLKKIGDRAFSYCINLEAFAFSGELEEIGDGAFDGCETLKEITFNGTKAQWNAIAKGYNWTLNTLATVVHCTDGDVEI